MCDYDGHHIAASRYLSEAKKRNKELKKLKSVSRAYRKSQVRGLKADAAREQVLSEVKSAEQKAKAEALRAAYDSYRAASGSQNYYNQGFANKIFG